MMKLFATALNGVEKGLKEEDGRGDLTGVQCKAIQNYNNDSPLHSEYILIKMIKGVTLHIL
jgi:hypothetical protein